MFGIPLELLALGLLVIANGLLAMAETAVVSARKSVLEREAQEGDLAAAAVLDLTRHPTLFLGLVQFWLTLSGMIAGVLAGTRFAEPVASRLSTVDWLAPWSHLLALIFVTFGLTVFLLLFGELIPKRIGLAHPEKVAKQLAGTMRSLSWLAAPLLWVFESAASGAIRLMRIKPRAAADTVGDDEVRALVEQGLHAGVFKRAEKEMVESVLELDDYPVTELMTPRPKIVFLNIDDPEEANWRKIVTSGHSYFPVYQRTRDQVVGLVSVKSLWAHSAVGLPTPLKNLLVPPLSVSEKLTAIQLLEKFKKTGKHIAIVTDEFGAIQGLVTLIDVLEAIVGDLPDHGPKHEMPAAHKREDGSWLIDATLPIGEFKDTIALDDDLPHEDEADFQTLGGFVMTQFGRIPKAGDHFEWEHLRFEVMDMDRHRVDKVLVTILAAKDGETEASA
jgi:putative hemolysin|uniref:hemolysin family protein n=1 Tax=Cephaloticoccus sp. TaxID=1985742 RepID=UPI00404AB8C4